MKMKSDFRFGVFDRGINAFGKFCNQFLTFVDRLSQPFIRSVLITHSI